MAIERPDLFSAIQRETKAIQEKAELYRAIKGSPEGHNRPVAVEFEFDSQVGHLNSTLSDLAKSGLTPQDVRARTLSGAERTVCSLGMQSEGYVIPYFSLSGSPIPYYRVKITTPQFEGGLKYKAPKKHPNHIYFPPTFRETLTHWLSKNPHTRVIIVTEGEKKASAACKMGFPSVGLSGVDSWRSRTILLPSDTELYQGAERGKKIRAKLPSSSSNIPELLSLAVGFGSLIDCIVQYGLTPIIIFDSDELGTLKSEVQRAATMLAYEMRFLGIPSNRIKQVILPDLYPGEDVELKHKVGLDDFLLSPKGGGIKLAHLIEGAYSNPDAFPRHPNPRGFINTLMQNSMERKEQHQIASIILSELDGRGLRLKDKFTSYPYYYDRISHKLMKAQLTSGRGNIMHESDFGTLLYQQYALSANDIKVMNVLASQYTGEEPVEEVQPKRVVTLLSEKEDPRNPDGIAFQVSDSRFIAISPNSRKPVELLDNGSKSVLFEQKQVEPLDEDRLLDYFDEFNNVPGNLPCWWLETFQDTNLGKLGPDRAAEGGSMRLYAALLFYVAPYLQRWRGLQLPVELMIGEAGSGKSSLYNLRLSVLTGRPSLRNLPSDIKDWYSSIGNTGALHVTDNVHFSQRELKQKLSDEMCRLVTEPNPTIEMRKLYSNNEQIRVPITTTFALTAIQMPFQNMDLIQRAAIFECCALGKAPDGDWVAKQLIDRGGREAWVAHQLVFLHRFLKLATADDGWDTNFKTANRLAHLEQTLRIAARVFGLSEEAASIGSTMLQVQDSNLVESDWTLNGVGQFICEEIPDNRTKFTTSDICNYLAADANYNDNGIATNPRKMGKYIQAHLSSLFKMYGLQALGKEQNRQMFIADPIKAKRAPKASV